MKKIVFAISIFAAIVMAACTPETRNEMLGIPDGAILLSTENYIGSDTKTAVSGTSVVWVGENEDIDFYVGTGDKQTRSVVVSGHNAYISSALEGSGEIRGYYPANLATSSQASDAPYVSIPKEYNCDVDASDRQVIALPMVAKAESGATSIRFRHLTAAINVVLKNSITGTTLYVDSVTVIADKSYLSTGNSGLTINMKNDSLGVTFAKAASPSQYNLASRKVKVCFPTGFEVAAGSMDKTIQVPVRPFESDYLTINVYCRSNSTRYAYSFKPDKKVPNLSRNNVLIAQVDLNTGGHMKVVHTVNLATVMGNFTAYNGDTLTGTPTTAPTVTIPAGYKVILNNVNCTSSKYVYFRAMGDDTVVLSGTNTLRGTTGGGSLLHVVPDYTLTIQGSGSLTISSVSSAAAIGSYADNPCGNILIKSGTINFTAGTMGGASIGCFTDYNCGDITIEGGSITATNGQSYAAAIGAGNGSGQCGKITITGGSIAAKGGSSAAAIGTGGNANSRCGDISISGVSSITATKGSGATSSIGRGHASSTVGTVTVMEVVGEKTDNYTYPTAK